MRFGKKRKPMLANPLAEVYTVNVHLDSFGFWLQLFLPDFEGDPKASLKTWSTFW